MEVPPGQTRCSVFYWGPNFPYGSYSKVCIGGNAIYDIIIIIIIIFIRINNFTYRVHIKHLSTNYIKIFRIENKLYYNNFFLQNHSNTI